MSDFDKTETNPHEEGGKGKIEEEDEH